MQNDIAVQPKTFRFKFTDMFVEELAAFAKLHQFDNRHDFKEAWEKWVNINKQIVEAEKAHLKTGGYLGDPIDKMYKSARYYFRKKSDEKTAPKKRRKYVALNDEIIENMDDHITNFVRQPNFKPSVAFDDFCKRNKDHLTKEIERLYVKEGLSTNEMHNKFKKTYKNRYFQTVKKPLME